MDPIFRQFLDELGLPKVPLFSDDVESPEPVDVEKIRAFNAEQLDPVEDEWVAFLVSHYRDWFEADLDLHGILPEPTSSDASDSPRTRDYSTALGPADSSRRFSHIFEVLPDDCDWTPIQSPGIAMGKGTVSVRAATDDSIRVTIAGFLRGPEVSRLTVVWRGSDGTPKATKVVNKPISTTVRLSSDGVLLAPGDTLHVTSEYAIGNDAPSRCSCKFNL